MLDSGSLEKERGITIMSKTTRVDWEKNIFNLVDTPGHSDFGGEVCIHHIVTSNIRPFIPIAI